MAETIAPRGYSDDEDRLPWLESVEDEQPARAPVWRVLLFVVAGLALIAAVIFAVLQFQGRDGAPGTGELIPAPAGSYKVKPDQPGGMKVEGEGDTVFATSEGGTSNGSVNLGAVPEAPIAATQAASPAAPPAAPAAGGARVETAIPQATGRLEARAPARSAAPVTAAATSGGAVAQLGSFPSEAGAKDAWSRLSKRFGYIEPLPQSIQQAEVNGKRVWRLRVDAGGAAQAGELCGKMRVAGEGCFVVR
jgi:hypothetical protein